MISRVRRIFCNLTGRRRKRFWLKHQLGNTLSCKGIKPQIEKLEDRSLLASMPWPLETTIIEGGLQALRGHDLQALLADTGSIRGNLENALGDLATARLPDSLRVNADTLANVIRTTNASVSDFELRFATSILPLDGDFEASLLNRISVSDVDLSQIIHSPQTLFTGAIMAGQRAPTLGPVSVSANGGVINEGDEFTLSGRYSDALTVSDQNVRVHWGDGTNSLAVVDTVLRSFSATHRYGDDGRMSIRVEVTDTSGAAAIATTTQLVRNVAPTVQISPNAANSDQNQIRLDGNSFDAGFLDTVSVVWLAYPAGSPLNSRTGTGTSFTLDRSAFPNGIWQITATATDDDGGASTFATALLVGTAGSESIQVNDATFSVVGANRLIVMGLDGNDIIDGSQIHSGNHQLILDGGLGVDYLFGGPGDDVYYLANGNDYANVSVPGGPNVIFQEGDDTYRLTPNSTLTVVDLVGNNTLDFGLSDFGDGTGITFDLGLVGSTAMAVQDVSSSQPSQHYVRTLGNFTAVIGSRFGDSLIATSGSTLWGGGGNDRFSIKNGTTGAVVWGGADDDILTTAVTTLSGLVFNGDDGNDSLENLGTIVNLVFNGGADDDALVNTGTIVTTLSFGGDDGADTLWNIGNIASIVFIGGADDDALVNTGTIVTTLSFGGDDGADTLWNTGRIEALVFAGGADDDALVNTGTIVTTLGFGGDEGADVLRNSGSIGAITFSGGADDDALVNTGTIVTTLGFGGDEGADTLWNTGSIVAIEFTGGADDDALVNTGTIVTTLGFGGDEGADTLVNEGSIGGLIFAGGADDDALVNTGTIVTTLSFGGDEGADTLVNSGVVARLFFDGGAGNDALQNNATVVSIAFQGGADDDALVNNGPTVTTIDFSGDDGADTLINNGSGVLAILAQGGSGPDSVRIEGREIGNVSFDGGIGADSFTFNAAGVGNSQVAFNAGAGSDFFVIRGSALAFAFDGGLGNDKLLVSGSGTMNLNGGEGDDSYQFIANPSADVVLAETFAGALDEYADTVDFSSFTGGAVSLDLRLVNTWQPQGSDQFRISLADGMSLENVIGTPLADTIKGNARNNSISGAEYSEPFAGPVASARGVTQWVFLDFESDTNTGILNPSTGLLDSGEHVYTVGERELIRQQVEANYRGPDFNTPWFDVRVVTELSSIPTAFRTGNEFASVYFNRTPPNGRPGGLASELDPGNINLGGSAVVQISGMLGGVIPRSAGMQDIEGDQDGFKSDVATISDIEIGASQPAATSKNFVKLSAKLAAHELAHLLGLRHQDSFGPIGSGVHNPPGGGAFNPVFNGYAGGFETFDHILGSPASVGSSRFSDLNSLFFGEREAIKLAFANSDSAQTTFFNAGGNQTQSTATALSPISILVPNTLSRGQNFQKAFSVQITSAIGQIELDTTTQRSRSDWYSFTGRAGELVNIDVLSNSVARFGTGANGVLTPNDYLDTIVRVYNASGGLIQYYDGLAENDDTFEPTDSSLVDLLLPTDGTFFIEVDSFHRLGDALGDPLNALSPLNPENPNNILSNADFFERFQDSVNDTDTGRYQLIMYKFRKANASDLIDNIKGFGGVDTINGGPDDSYALSYDLGVDATAAEGIAFTRTVTILDRAASSWTGSHVDFGDGTGFQPLIVSSDGEFTLNHIWKDNGSYTIRVFVVDDIGQTLTVSTSITVNAIPTVAVSAPIDGVRGVASNFTFTATDEDVDDQAGLFTFVIRWGDGSKEMFRDQPSTTVISHVYSKVSSDGVFTVSATAIDARGATSVVASKDFAVLGWTLMSDPIAPSHAILVIVGTQGSDDIKVKLKDVDYYKVSIRDRDEDVKFRGTVFGDVRKILVFAHGGDDRVTMDDDVELTTEVWGGSGDDAIKGGSGSDILQGESGDDRLWGGDGRDFIVGGIGADKLYGNGYDDILIAGFTAFELELNLWAPDAIPDSMRLTLNQQRTALEAISAEWASSRSYSVRRNNIRGTGTGIRNNGGYFLKASETSMINNTVFDDSSVDKLWGDSGSDWFFSSLNGGTNSVLDQVKDKSGIESAEDIDRWW